MLSLDFRRISPLQTMSYLPLNHHSTDDVNAGSCKL